MEVSLQNRQQDLDDHEQGELLKFLPSDIFPLDQQPQVLSPLSSSSHNQLNYSNCSYNHSYVHHAPASCMDLSQGLAAFSFVWPSPQPPPQGFHIMPAANLVQFFFALACVPFVYYHSCLFNFSILFSFGSIQLFGPAHQPSFPDSLPNQCCFICGDWVVGANHVGQYRAGAGWPSYGSVRNPVQSQADRFMEQRAKFLQVMHHHCWVNRVMERRIFPFRGSGFGFAGGTGVYLPRIPAPNIKHPRSRRQSGRSRRRDGEDVKNLVNKKKQEECRSRASPEVVGLPEDWIY